MLCIFEEHFSTTIILMIANESENGYNLRKNATEVSYDLFMLHTSII